MTKYANYDIVFAEIPDEVTLAINISNCPCHCVGCHSSQLADDIGEELTGEVIRDLVKSNKGITCIGFMGGDANPVEISEFARLIRESSNIKTAWYSGRPALPTDPEFNTKYFNYIKLGPYIKELGPLNNKMTNQRLYMNPHVDIIEDDFSNWLDITKRFWK